jgi:hypothetical protein
MGVPTNHNGNGKVLYWLAGLLIPTLFGGAIGWVSTMHRSAQAHAEQLAVLQSQMHDTRDELQRINNKLDRLLLRKE